MIRSGQHNEVHYPCSLLCTGTVEQHTHAQQVTMYTAELSKAHLIQPLLMQLLSCKHQLIIGFLNMLAMLLPAGCSFVALCIALPDGLAHQVVLSFLNADSPGVLRLQHLRAPVASGPVNIKSRSR